MKASARDSGWNRIYALSVRVIATVALLPSPVIAGNADPCDDQQFCDDTGGNWNPLCAGHYVCGAFPDCDPIIPVCDCGPGRNFSPELGCVLDPARGLQPVQVIVDMDLQEPGFQSFVTVSACSSVVQTAAVYIRDPLQERTMWSIGYLGGLDRGISFGHMPNEAANQGSVADMTAAPMTPVNPGNVGWITQAPYYDPGFVGPEVQYFESGAETPAVIQGEPAEPVFTVDITLKDAMPGDRFDFYLLDFVTVWTSGEYGAFSTQGPFTLDTGGDAVPDATNTIYGIDPDGAIPVPPASYFVDYIDGPPNGGPAVIEVVPRLGDLNDDGIVDAADLALLLGNWGPVDCAGGGCPDFNGDGVVDAADLAQLLGNWGACPV